MTITCCVVGAGAWGTTIAKCLAENGHDVSLWCYSEPLKDEIFLLKRHHRLPNISLPSIIKPVRSFDACYDADLICIGLSSEQLECWDHAIQWQKIQSPICVLAKGIMSDGTLILDWLRNRTQAPLAVLSGPNLAIEVAQNKPTASVVASTDLVSLEGIQRALSNHYFRCYTSQDVIGVQCGGVFKNVFAIAAGCIDGMNLGANAKATLITRGLVELTKVATAFGGSAETMMGLSGLGDLIATCGSEKSRNWQFGYSLATEKKIQLHSIDRGQTEGIRTIQCMMPILRKNQVDVPIITAVWRLVNQKETPINLIRELMERGLKSENSN